MWTFHNMICFYGEELLAPRPIPKLDDHPMSAVRDCLFSIFATTLPIGDRSSIRNLRTRHAVVTGTLWINIINILHQFFLCSRDRASQFYINKCPTKCNYTQFISSVNCCTCFGWFFHPSSVAQITVSTASGTSQLLVVVTCRYRGGAETQSQLPHDSYR